MHAYSLSDCKEYNYQGKNIRLVKLCNPWGYKEFSGDWSDKSPLINEELKKVFNHVQEDDGTLYLSIEDYANFFIWTYIGHIMYDCNIKSITLSENDLKTPQVFNVYIDREMQTQRYH